MLRDTLMSESPTTPSGAPEPEAEGGVAESLRAAVERTMRATAGSAASTRERAAELVDDVVRRGREARDELARRGQEAGVGLARRGQEATGEVSRRVETLERRLAELERRLDATAGEQLPLAGEEAAAEEPPGGKSQSQAEG
jgi:polyhydroxyalkanoate synthesis regulator phasin